MRQFAGDSWWTCAADRKPTEVVIALTRGAMIDRDDLQTERPALLRGDPRGDCPNDARNVAQTVAAKRVRHFGPGAALRRQECSRTRAARPIYASKFRKYLLPPLCFVAFLALALSCLAAPCVSRLSRSPLSRFFSPPSSLARLPGFASRLFPPLSPLTYALLPFSP